MFRYQRVLHSVKHRKYIMTAINEFSPKIFVKVNNIQTHISFIQKMDVLFWDIKTQLSNNTCDLQDSRSNVYRGISKWEPKLVQPILFSFQYVCAHDRKNVTNVNLGLYKNYVIVYRLNAFDMDIDEDSNVVLLPHY